MRVFSTGSRKGKTFLWGVGEEKFSFVDGVCEIPDNSPSLVQYLRFNLQVRTELEALPPEEREVVVETDPLRLAIVALDPENDSLWNQNGQPAIDALTEFPSITRKQVEATASDLTRAEVRRRLAE